MKCPTCKGKKIIWGIGHNPDKGCRVIDIPCILCDGKGTITTQQKKWGVEGEKMHQDRLARLMTLRNECRRRNIDPCVLSAMEMGKIKPVWDPKIKK